MIGADISEWQSIWAPRQFNQYGFVIIRYGTGENPGGNRPQPWEDKCFQQNWVNAKGQTIRGAYWYADPRRDAAEVQADRFYAGVSAAGYGPDDLPLMLDYEQDMGGFNYQGWALAFLTRLESHIGRPPILYISQSRISEWLGNNQVFARYPLMVASYGVNDGQMHGVSTPWPWVIHQYTSKPFDLDYADDAALRALVHQGVFMALSDQEQTALMQWVDEIHSALFNPGKLGNPPKTRIEDLAALVTGLHTGSVDPKAVADLVVQGVGAGIAKQVADELERRLAS